MIYISRPLRGTIVLFVDASEIERYNKTSLIPVDIKQVHSVRHIESGTNNVRLENVNLNTGLHRKSNPNGALRWDRFRVLMLPPDESYYVNRIEEEGGDI